MNFLKISAKQSNHTNSLRVATHRYAAIRHWLVITGRHLNEHPKLKIADRFTLAHPSLIIVDSYTLWHTRTLKLLTATDIGTPELQTCWPLYTLAHPSLKIVDKHEQAHYLNQTGQLHTQQKATATCARSQSLAVSI